jgi:hypothetical protein
MRLPKPGKVGAPSNELHLRCAAEHVAKHPEHQHTDAYLDLARRGRELPPVTHKESQNDDSNPL